MKIAVCDDELAMLKLVSTYIRAEFEKHRIAVTVSSYINAVQLLKDVPVKEYDVVFLDIRMPSINGFEAAKEIRNSSPDTKIVFITTEEDLVYDSFDFQPFAFIPKHPPEAMKTRLSRTAENLLSAVKSNRKVCIYLPYNDKMYVRPNKLIYINSNKNNLYYHLTDCEDISIRAKMSEIEETLPTDLFVRIHNRIIVNMQHITNIESDRSMLTVTGGEDLGISRTYRTEFDEAYDSFIREKK